MWIYSIYVTILFLFQNFTLYNDLDVESIELYNNKHILPF